MTEINFTKIYSRWGFIYPNYAYYEFISAITKHYFIYAICIFLLFLVQLSPYNFMISILLHSFSMFLIRADNRKVVVEIGKFNSSTHVNKPDSPIKKHLYILSSLKYFFYILCTLIIVVIFLNANLT